MRKVGISVLLFLSAVAYGQTINPNQIRPATTNGYVLTTVGGATVWAPAGGGGTGCIPSGTGILQISNGSGGCSGTPSDYGITSANSFTFAPPTGNFDVVTALDDISFKAGSGTGTCATCDYSVLADRDVTEQAYTGDVNIQAGHTSSTTTSSLNLEGNEASLLADNGDLNIAQHGSSDVINMFSAGDTNIDATGHVALASVDITNPGSGSSALCINSSGQMGTFGCGGGGSGTVTSVSFTGGLISVATATTTPALTVAGTSGGIPYFSGAATWASSAALPSGDFVLGGGAGSAPTASFSIVTAAKGGTGIANTATLTLGTSNQNWATLGTGIVKNTTTTGALTNAASSDVIGLWTGSCSSSTFLRGDGACATASGSTGISGLTAGYIPLAGSSTTITANSHIDDGVTTAATLTASEPLAVTGAPGIIMAHASAASGVAGSVVYTVDATNGYGEINENNTGLSRICTAANGVCTGSSVTVNGSAVANPNFANNSGAGEIDFTNPSGSTVNATIHNTSINVNGQTCTLGSTCTVSAGGVFGSYYFPATCTGGVAFTANFSTYDNNAPSPQCIAPSTSTDAAMNFALVPSANQYAGTKVPIPPYWTGTSATLLFTSNITSGNFVWNIQTACPAVSGSTPGSPTWGTAATSTVTVPGVAGQQASVTFTGIAANSVNGCPAVGTTTASVLDVRVFVTAGTATGSTSVAGLIGVIFNTAHSQ